MDFIQARAAEATPAGACQAPGRQKTSDIVALGRVGPEKATKNVNLQRAPELH
jgi:hypothetical protein